MRPKTLKAFKVPEWPLISKTKIISPHIWGRNDTKN
jgi:hypothetical protein